MTSTTVYGVYARFDGRPAGFVAYYVTRQAAEQGRKRTRMSTIIKRELMPDSTRALYRLGADARLIGVATVDDALAAQRSCILALDAAR